MRWGENGLIRQYLRHFVTSAFTVRIVALIPTLLPNLLLADHEASYVTLLARIFGRPHQSAR